jgi:predicted nucleotidyltransferase
MPKYGLLPDQIEKLQAIFAKYPQVKRVLIYGSRAKGDYRNGSDIDLTLLGESLDLAVQFDIENELDDLLLPYKIDLSIFPHIDNPGLLAHIQRVGLPFFVRSENVVQV